MANQLGMAEQQAILVLSSRGWSRRRIARELGVHRDTVARYIDLAAAAAHGATGPPGEGHPGGRAGACGADDPSKPAISIIGSDSNGASKPAISITGSAGRQSQCYPYRDAILAKLEQGLSAQRIWQDLRAEHGFTDGYPSVQRFVRHLRSKAPLPFRRMETAPGEQAQVDFGTGAPVITPEGQALPVGSKSRRRKTHVFRIVLSHRARPTARWYIARRRRTSFAASRMPSIASAACPRR